MQVAQFVAKREAAGDSRSTSSALGKPKSFISELAHLIAPGRRSIRDAFERARI